MNAVNLADAKAHLSEAVDRLTAVVKPDIVSVQLDDTQLHLEPGETARGGRERPERFSEKSVDLSMDSGPH